MQSYQISLSTPRRAAGRFIAMVRREIQKALAEEHAINGVTQASIASALNVNRSVIHRQIMGFENLSLGRVGEIADLLDRDVMFSLTRRQAVGNHRNISRPASSSPQIDTGPIIRTTATDSVSALVT
jgi:hypothetical protein